MSAQFQFDRIRDDKDSVALCRIAGQTFNHPFDKDGWQTYLSNVEPDNVRIARRGTEIVGGLAIYRSKQWFGGQAIPMAGIALVCVAPEFRKSGVARFLLAETLRELQSDGVPLSVLYASTQRPYRQAGYEQAGDAYMHRMAMAHIGPCEPLAPLRPVPLEPSPELSRLAERRARSGSGHLHRSPGMWRRLFDQRTAAAYCYLIGEEEDPQGYFISAQYRDPATNMNRLLIRDVVTHTPAAAMSFWAFINSHRSIFDDFQWYGPASEPLLLLPAEERASIVSRERWMLRVVDVRRALALRGYPEHVAGELHFEIRDELIESNAGRMVLSVTAGKGSLHEGGRGDIQLPVRSLAPLYTGLFAATDLRAMGLLQGPDSALELATQLFRGSPPWMADRF